MAQAEPTPKRRPPANPTRPDARQNQQPKRQPQRPPAYGGGYNPTVAPTQPSSSVPAWLGGVAGNLSNWLQQQFNRPPAYGGVYNPTVSQPPAWWQQLSQPNTPAQSVQPWYSGLLSAYGQSIPGQSNLPPTPTAMTPALQSQIGQALTGAPTILPTQPVTTGPEDFGQRYREQLPRMQPPEGNLADFYFRHPDTPALPPQTEIPSSGGYGSSYRRKRYGGGGRGGYGGYGGGEPYQRQSYEPSNSPAWLSGLANWTIG